MREGYPAQSFDLNAIERVWGVFNGKMLGTSARTSDGWRRALKRAGDKVEQSTIDKIIGGVTPRMQKVVDTGGAWIRDE